MSVIHLTSKNFQDEVMNSDKTVMIDFWASWCAPCRMVAPIIDQLAEEVTTAKIGKVNIDEERGLAEKFGIMSIPTMVVIKNGKVVDTVVGVRRKSELKELIER